MNVCKTWNKINEHLSPYFDVSTMNNEQWKCNQARFRIRYDMKWKCCFINFKLRWKKVQRIVMSYDGKKWKSFHRVSLSRNVIFLFKARPLLCYKIISIHFHFVNSRLKLKFFSYKNFCFVRHKIKESNENPWFANKHVIVVIEQIPNVILLEPRTTLYRLSHETFIDKSNVNKRNIVCRTI